MRGFVPPSVFTSASQQSLMQAGLSPALARRVFDKKVCLRVCSSAVCASFRLSRWLTILLRRLRNLTHSLTHSLTITHSRTH